MGNKIITEKDFWMCTSGAMPAQLQGTRKSNKKESGEIYITVADTATSSWIDFGCTKHMLFAALIAAVVAVVVVALIVGTGGIAAIGLMGMMAIGAGAGLAGGIVAAVNGALKCGQKNAGARKWDSSKQNLILTGTPAITGDRTMTCKIGGVVKFAPEIKSWSQAIALGGFNYLTKGAECMLAGAAVGGGGYMLSGIATGSLALAMPTAGSIVSNVATSFTGIWGGTRVLFGANTLANESALGNVNGAGDALSTFGGGAVPEVGMGKRIITGQAQPSDYLLFLYLLNVKAKGNTPVTEEPQTKGDKESSSPKEEENTQPKEEESAPNKGQAREEVKQSENNKKGDAFEDSVSNSTKGDIGEARVIEQLKADGYTEVIQVQNNSGHGVDVIARNPTNGHVKCVEVKANTSRLSEAQAQGGEIYVKDRLQRAVDGNGHYKVPPNPPELPAKAQQAQEWINDAPKIDYEVHQVPVDNTTGVAGDPKVKPWDPKVDPETKGDK